MTVAIVSKLGPASQVSTLPAITAAETEGATDRFRAFLASFEHPSAPPATALTPSQTDSRQSDNAQNKTLAADARAATPVTTHPSPDAKNASRGSPACSTGESDHSDLTGKTNRTGPAAQTVTANGKKIAPQSGSRPTAGQSKDAPSLRQGTREQPSVSPGARSAIATPLSSATAAGSVVPAVAQDIVAQSAVAQDTAIPSMPAPTMSPGPPGQAEVATIDTVAGGSPPARQAATVGSGSDPFQAGDVPSSDELPNGVSFPDVAIDTDVPVTHLDDTTASGASTPDAPEPQDIGEDPARSEETIADAGLTMVHQVADEQHTTHVTLDLGDRGSVQIDVAKDHHGTAVSIRADAGLAQELGEHRDDIVRAVNGVEAGQVIMSQQIRIASIGIAGVSSSLSPAEPSASTRSTGSHDENGYDVAEPSADGAQPGASKPGETRYRRRFVNVFV